MTGKEKDENVKLIIALVGMASFIPCVLLSGYTITKLWGWFIVPVFTVSPLTIMQGLGISLLINYLTWRKQYYKTDNISEELVRDILSMWLKPLIFLGTGWIYTWFI